MSVGEALHDRWRQIVNFLLRPKPIARHCRKLWRQLGSNGSNPRILSAAKTFAHVSLALELQLVTGCNNFLWWRCHEAQYQPLLATIIYELHAVVLNNKLLIQHLWLINLWLISHAVVTKPIIDKPCCSVLILSWTPEERFEQIIGVALQNDL